MKDVLAHEQERPDVIVRLQPTSPFRTAGSINWALKLLEAGAGAVVGVTPNPKHPLLEVKLGDDNIMTHNPGLRNPRQVYPESWVINGAIYAARTDYWEEHGGMYGPSTYGLRMDAAESIDIDTPFDLDVARALVAAAG